MNKLKLFLAFIMFFNIPLVAEGAFTTVMVSAKDTAKYIESVNELYMKHFHEYTSSPVLIINTSNVNINDKNDYQLLIEEISSDINGKKYFNPSSIK